MKFGLLLGLGLLLVDVSATPIICLVSVLLSVSDSDKLTPYGGRKAGVDIHSLFEVY